LLPQSEERPVVIKRPSPALAVAVLALFLALVGSGFAATGGQAPAHKRKPKHTTTLTAAGVNKLIGTYLRRHSIGQRGRTGATGAQGKTGAQGPGAKRIVVINSGNRTPFDVATVGPWTVRLECLQSAAVNIVGPGSFFATTVTGDPAPTGMGPPLGIAAVDNRPLGNGFTTGTDTISNTHPRRQESVDVTLISGSTMFELRLQLAAEPMAGLPTATCNLVGSATPVT
jgi:hypothetical protein